jgi:hypothetical protein
LVDIDGTRPSIDVARQVEASTSALPSMVVTTAGAFSGVAGVNEMMSRLAGDYPEHDYRDLAALVASPHAKTSFFAALAGRWDCWIGLWRRVAVPGENPQLISNAEGSRGTLTLVTYDGPAAAGRVRFHSRRVFNDEEVRELEPSLMLSLGMRSRNMRGALRRAEVEQDVDTDWPALRPRLAHSRNTAVFEFEGHRQPYIDVHEYLFDWNGSERGTSHCGAPMP